MSPEAESENAMCGKILRDKVKSGPSMRPFMTRPIFGLAVAAVAASLASCGDQSGGGKPPAGGPPGMGAAQTPKVGVVTLHPQSVPLVTSLAGRTVAFATAEIRPQVGGILKQRVFKEGSQVKAGDLLYEIDPRPYAASLASAQAALSRAKAAVPSAQAKVTRYEELAKVKGVSQQDLDDARSTLLQANADVESAAANVETAQINLDYTRITSPISGLIGRSSVTQGALVTASQTTALATVRQIDPMFVDLTESSANLLRLRKILGPEIARRPDKPPAVRLTLEDGSAFAPAGVVESLEASVSETTGSFTIRARFPNPDHILMPGMYVRAEIEVGTDENVFLVPQRAVSRNARGEATALFVGADGKAEARILDTSQSHGSAWLVRAGIKDGDRLIVDGLQNAHAGAPVEPIEVVVDAAGLVQPKPAAN
jgi:membrane fusion protein (multidrug efflux system)